MLTVKHIENYHESICSASHVTFTRKKLEDNHNVLECELTAWGVGDFSPSNDDNAHYDSGTVYVMNEGGKTVGVYEL